MAEQPRPGDQQPPGPSGPSLVVSVGHRLDHLACDAEIVRLGDRVATLGREHARHSLAVSAHQARADQQESRAVRAESALARFADQAARYDELAEQAAGGERAAAAADELRRANEVLTGHVGWLRIELDKADAKLASIATRLPAIRHALEFTGGHGEARTDCREALETLDGVWPF